jgi:hypothetical protein
MIVKVTVFPGVALSVTESLLSVAASLSPKAPFAGLLVSVSGPRMLP